MGHYSAEIAGVNYSLAAGGNGLVLRFAGFSHKIPELLQAVLSRAVAPFGSGGGGAGGGGGGGSRVFAVERFEKLREAKSRAYRNATKEQPHAYARYLRSQLLYAGVRTREEMLCAIDGAELDEVEWPSWRLSFCCTPLPIKWVLQ